MTPEHACVLTAGGNVESAVAWRVQLEALARVAAHREDFLTEEDDELLALVRALPGPWWLKDAEGRYCYMSAATEHLFGPKGATALGRMAHDVFPPAIADELVAADRRVLATGEPVMMPIWLPDDTGGRRHFAVVKFPVAGPGGARVGCLALDMTKFSTAAWEASTYQQILDAITDMVLVKGPRSKLRWANKAFLEAYGMTNIELQGIIDAPFVEPDITQQYVKDDEAVFTTGQSLDIPHELMTRWDGSVRTCHTVKSPIFDDAGNVTMTVAVIRDITEKKRLELGLRQAQKLESIGRLASGMAHEINTPLQYVGHHAEFAQSVVTDLLGLVARYQAVVAKVEAGTATVADAVAVREAEREVDLAYAQEHAPFAFVTMLEGVQRIAKLVHALREFGHPDAGKKEAADINAALRSTAVITAHEYNGVADAALDLGAIPLVVCNISELKQVFLNLIVNAAHAIVELRSSERGTIRITTRTDGGDVLISVADTGCGIAESVRSRIFEPFFTTKDIGQGAGQGLAISRLVVDKHGGTLTFETELGRGTTFHVRIPREPAVSDP